ncbi:hypothetical protein Taro_047119 [Colocasia esculenta]|uniref:Uncharacterized protein n=1 Tax=Colocasia esculenta TaxID=4460 RepID=A0A843X7S6_COLES|nr:hypothetical protein [Colocasia esculenta]
MRSKERKGLEQGGFFFLFVVNPRFSLHHKKDSRDLTSNSLSDSSIGTNLDISSPDSSISAHTLPNTHRSGKPAESERSNVMNMQVKGASSDVFREEETGGPVAYTELFRRTHKRKELGDIVSQRAKEVVDSYEQQLIERHGDDSSQHPQFDASAWLVATGQPKKGRVFGFGIGMDAGGVINSTMESGCSAASYSYTQSPPPPQQPTELPDHYCSAFIKQLDNWFDRTVVPALHAMGVAFPHPPLPPSPSAADFGQAVGEQANSDADVEDHETHLADD